MLDVNMNSLWMVPWDAGGTFRIGSRPEVVIRRDRLRWVVQLSCRPTFGGLVGTCVIDFTPVEIMVEDKMPDFLELASTDSRGCDYVYSLDGGSKTDLGFPRASCTTVEMCAVDSKFPRASFPPGEICAERQDYVRRASLTGSPVCTQTVTGSLLFGYPRLSGALPVRRCFFLGGLMNWRTSQFADDGPVCVGRTCRPIFL